MEMIEQWIASYKPNTVEDFINAKLVGLWFDQLSCVVNL